MTQGDKELLQILGLQRFSRRALLCTLGSKHLQVDLGLSKLTNMLEFQ